nr:hypothetical protein BaRGS_010442 [Batillaria attramentaria]
MDARLAALEAEKGDLAKYATILQKTVLFHAQLAGDVLLGEGARILFDRVVINQGDAYNATLGEFTAPYNGFYFFTATAMGFTDQDWPLTDGVYARMKMKVDGSTVVRIRSLSIEYYETGTGTYAAHLTAGQQVWLQAYGESNRFDDKETTFSGFLVRADD